MELVEFSRENQKEYFAIHFKYINVVIIDHTFYNGQGKAMIRGGHFNVI